MFAIFYGDIPTSTFTEDEMRETMRVFLNFLSARQMCPECQAVLLTAKHIHSLLGNVDRSLVVISTVQCITVKHCVAYVENKKNCIIIVHFFPRGKWK